jgi:hypothetical protein
MVQSPSDSTWHLNTPKLPNDNQADKPIYLNSCNSPILTMHLFNTIMTFITFLLTLVPLAASVLLSKRILNDPGQKYLESICLPHIKSLTADQLIAGIEHSPFPCEQEIYLLNICTANGTAEIDFLAEQQCLCGSPYFDLILQCDACLYTHGLIVTNTPAQVTSFWSAMQTAECSPSPPYQPFSNLFPAVDYSYQSLSPSLTLAPDRFPNITAVSLYVTQTRSATPGLISGSATGRLTTWTNSNGIRYAYGPVYIRYIRLLLPTY